ncbi:MAG TPA: sodium:solute symporter [bacterium]|nr:sodium:solute symporter [bacterium]
MDSPLGWLDSVILIAYAVLMAGTGIYSMRKTRTAEEYMVAGRAIPAWAAGLAIFGAYTSSISYIATPGKAFDTNWHPFIFSLTIFPIAWVSCKYVIPQYRNSGLISVYAFLDERLGSWARFYSSLSFLLYETSRTAVILYLSGLLVSHYLPLSIGWIIILVGVITIFYTLLGGMEAVIWTDVVQSAVMIVGIVCCVYLLTVAVFSQPDYLIQTAIDKGKFSWGSWDFTLSSEAGTRTIWVMIIYGVVENLRSLIADQNYVQKYVSVATEKEARRSVWIGMWVYIPLTALFLYLGTALFAFYSGGGHVLPDSITKGDQVFPYYIATALPIGLKGLIVAAILAAAMSTISSSLNCSATITMIDFWKMYVNPAISEEGSMRFLRKMTFFWGVLGAGFALLMIKAASALDIWWTFAGIFGGGMLGLFLLALFHVPLRRWQGVTIIIVSILVIIWGTFSPKLPSDLQWLALNVDDILLGPAGTFAMLVLAFLFGWANRRMMRT